MAIAIEITNNTELHGFAALSYINSNKNPFYGDTLDGSFDFHEAALNGFWEASDSLRFSGQVLYRNTGDLYEDKFHLDFLMADFKWLSKDSHTLGTRLGRVKVPYGLYNSSRDVPHGKPGIFVPKSLYFESLRDAILSSDGITIYGNSYNSWGNFDYQFFLGKSDLNNSSLEHFLFSSDIPGSFDKTNLKGLQFIFTPEKLSQLKLGYSLLKVDMKLENGSTTSATQLAQSYASQYLIANATNPLAPTTNELNQSQLYAQNQLNQELSNFRSYLNSAKLDSYMHVLSAQYYWQNFTFTGEYLRIYNTIDTEVAYTGIQSNKATSEAYYAQVEWQAMEKLLLLARYEEFYNDTSDRDGSKSFASGNLISPYTNYSKGYTLGARWYFNSDLSVTAEFSHNKGASWLPKSKTINVSNLQESWDYYALQLSYHF